MIKKEKFPVEPVDLVLVARAASVLIHTWAALSTLFDTLEAGYQPLALHF